MLIHTKQGKLFFGNNFFKNVAITKKGEKMNNKIGVASSTYPGFSTAEVLDSISKSGFKYVELA